MLRAIVGISLCECYLSLSIPLLIGFAVTILITSLCICEHVSVGVIIRYLIVVSLCVYIYMFNLHVELCCKIVVQFIVSVVVHESCNCSITSIYDWY